MKKFALIAAMTLLASTAMAGIDADVGDVVYVPNGGYDLSLLAGPITLQNNTQGNSFQTFCVEIGELIYVPNVPYTVTGIGVTTVSSDYTMSERTAWLYTNFRNGALSGYADTNAVNDALQYSIWRSMGYSHSQLVNHFPSKAGQLNNARNLAASNGWWQDGILEFDVAGWDGFGNVRVANLTRNSNGEGGQDQLVLVPVPGAVLLGVVGLGLVARMKRHLA